MTITEAKRQLETLEDSALTTMLREDSAEFIFQKIYPLKAKLQDYQAQNSSGNISIELLEEIENLCIPAPLDESEPTSSYVNQD